MALIVKRAAPEKEGTWLATRRGERCLIQQHEVIDLCRQFEANSIRYWLVGGWGVDALLGEQTRPHKDLDMLVDVVRLAVTRKVLRHAGYTLKHLWSDQNVWLPGAQDESEAELATAFVLHHPGGAEADIHVLAFESGAPTPLWTTEQKLTARDLDGDGRIGELRVPCMSTENQIRRHREYDPPADQAEDLRRLEELRQAPE